MIPLHPPKPPWSGIVINYYLCKYWFKWEHQGLKAIIILIVSTLDEGDGFCVEVLHLGACGRTHSLDMRIPRMIDNSIGLSQPGAVWHFFQSPPITRVFHIARKEVTDVTGPAR